MSQRQETSISEPSANRRPATAQRRPRTNAGRPRTAARPPTSRPDTSVSSIGEIPDQTFYPEDDGEDYFDEEEELSDPEPDVFAFERPVTAAVAGMGSPVLSDTTGTARTFQRTDKDLGSRGTEVPRTMETTATSTFAYVANANGLGVARGVSHQPQPHTATTDPLTSSVVVLNYGLNNGGSGENLMGTNQIRRSSNPNVTAYLPAVATIDPRQDPNSIPPGRAIPQDQRQIHYKSSDPSMQETTDDGASSFPQSRENVGELPIGRTNTKSRAPLVDKLGSEYISDGGSRPVTRATWHLSEIEGATTIPDGMTTRGDGLGQNLQKWDEEGASANFADLEEEEDSPYPEVRASVSNIDDPEMPSEYRQRLFMWIS